MCRTLCTLRHGEVKATRDTVETDVIVVKRHKLLQHAAAGASIVSDRGACSWSCTVFNSSRFVRNPQGLHHPANALSTIHAMSPMTAAMLETWGPKFQRTVLKRSKTCANPGSPPAGQP